jgi:uncharacterized protein
MNTEFFHVLAKPVGPICNLDCKYCFYLEKEALYPGKTQWAMAGEVLDSFVRQYIEAQQSPVIHFAWQGGEPTLLGVEYFQKAVALQQRYANGKRIENSFQTNGVLLNEGWARFFAENGFLVGVSIDGPRELHDAYRVDKGGQPTFDRVLRGIEVLKTHGVEFNTLTTVHGANATHPREVYRFLKDNGSGYMQFIPIVERVAPETTANGLQLATPDCATPAQVTPWSVEPLQFGGFLTAIFDEWVRNDVGRVFVQLFDVSLESWVGMEPSLCIFRKQCGSALAIEHNGDLYSCDHFVYPKNRLGNILSTSLAQLAQSEEQQRFGEAKETSLPAYCLSCEVRFACNGECPKHRFALTPDGEPGLNYLCAGYKMFFQHLDPYMRFMANQLRMRQAPAHVMDWAAARDAAAAPESGVGPVSAPVV